jgi:hypothetical protein
MMALKLFSRCAASPCRYVLPALAVGVLAWYLYPASSQQYLPDFMRRPYEPLSRTELVSVANREWLLFGQQIHNEVMDGVEDPNTVNKPERNPGLWQRVGEYYWLGLDASARQRNATGKHDDAGVYLPPEKDWLYAWSAAFVSYVMRVSGAGERFPYSENHSRYINAAREASLDKRRDLVVFAEDPAVYAPRIGDLICYARSRTSMMRFEDLPSAQEFSSHCDIVAGSEPGILSVIGGNIADAVSMKHVPVAEDGRLIGPDGMLLDRRYNWMVVLRVQYDQD